MQVVINISEEDYKSLNRYTSFADNHDGRILKAVHEGIPLPEWHGRLIDAKCLSYRAETCIETTDAFVALIEDAPTIIPAEGE